MFYLYVGAEVLTFDTKDAAIAAGHEKQRNGGPEAWAVEDSEGFVVYQEFPRPHWV